MIFVTVGTHEQQFNRLIEYIDLCKKNGDIEEDVIIQAGYSTYIPQYCEYYKIIPYEKMDEYLQKARIVITHGGPSSFISALQRGKIPIVVPRYKDYGEHVNNHQKDFVEKVENRYGNIIPIYDINNLLEAIINYNQLLTSINANTESNNLRFCTLFEEIVVNLFKSRSV